MNIIKKLICLNGLSAFLFTGCSGGKAFIENASGKYSVQVISGASNSNPVVVGTFYDYDTKKVIANHVGIRLESDSVQVLARSDQKSTVEFKIKPGSYRFSGIAFPYKPVISKQISLKLGDTAKYDFYLKPASHKFHD